MSNTQATALPRGAAVSDEGKGACITSSMVKAARRCRGVGAVRRQHGGAEQANQSR